MWPLSFGAMSSSFYGFPTLEVSLNAISFANFLKAFTKSSIVWYSYVTFADGFVFFVAVSGCFWSTCLHPCILFMAHAGYLQVDKALCICACSSASRSLLEQISLALCNSELITLYLLDMAWWLSH